MKNCQIVIKRKNHHTVEFIFDDFRIAQAVINILDNVAERHIEGEVDFFELTPIQKNIYEDKLWKDLLNAK